MANLTVHEAAEKMNVSTNTVRRWCRTGKVDAFKDKGRWTIRTEAEMNAQTLTAVGGHRWSKSGHDRVYFNDWPRLVGLRVSHYNTGNISSASFQGEGISNSQARKILGSLDRVHYDLNAGTFRASTIDTGCRIASPDELLDMVADAVKERVDAL